MKKFASVLSLLAAIIILQGASVWEGAAAVSMDFPESGLFVATNSFPKNSVVDLTNLETGKTVRVIVTSGLDTPGLLALVSQEAAEAVGLRSRTIGRIRMIAPQDPIAFSRFSEEYFSGDPDYDPLAAVENIYGKEPVPPTDASVLADSTEPIDDEGSLVAVITEPLYVEDSLLDSELLSDEPDSAWDTDIVLDEGMDEPVVTETFPVDIDDTSDAWDPIPVESDLVGEDPIMDIPETSDVIAMAPSSLEPMLTDLPEDTIPAPIAVVVPEPEITPTPPSTTDYSYTLIPAEERPPEPVNVQPGSAVPQIFSVPAVSDLERGKYYLQLGAYSHTATVEQELSKIEQGYPLTVQSIVLSGKPVYRILIGPVNQGESGALLKQFKARGYKDAFVRLAQ